MFSDQFQSSFYKVIFKKLSFSLLWKLNGVLSSWFNKIISDVSGYLTNNYNSVRLTIINLGSIVITFV